VLADLLDDNAALHEVYPLMARARDPAGGLAQALRHVESLRERSAHATTREACAKLAAALEGLEEVADASSATLAEALRRTEAAMAAPTTASRERDILLLRIHLLRRALANAPAIPRIVHLIRTDDSSADLPLIQYLCYRSVLAHCKGYRVMLHTPALPQGRRWSTLLPDLDVRIGSTPQWLGDRRLVAAAHQSDVWRVRQVIEHGGFYFDWDLLLLRPPEALRSLVCVMALERKEPDYHEVLGVSMIGAEPGSTFLRKWLDEMPAVFNPRKYVSHSVVLAHRLAIELPSLVRVLDYRSFYDPGWSEGAMKWLFDPAERLPDERLRERLSAATGMHLFCSHANFVHWARELSEKDVEADRCNLAALLKPYL
jgi:hypothetical protein